MMTLLMLLSITVVSPQAILAYVSAKLWLDSPIIPTAFASMVSLLSSLHSSKLLLSPKFWH